MSFWLKRVESFLEQVDQSAATQIGTLKNDEPGGTANRESNASYNDPYVSSRPTNGTTASTKSKSSTSASAAPPSKPRDDDIFKFLNDNDATPPPASSVQRIAMPVPKTKKEKVKKSVAHAPRASTPTQVVAPASAQPPKPKTPPSPPSVTPPQPSINPPQPSISPPQSSVPSPQLSPTRESAQEKLPESELKVELEPSSVTSEPSEHPVDSAEGGEKGGWDDGDVVVGEEDGKKSPVRSSSPATQDHVEDEGQKKEVEINQTENTEHSESNNILPHTDAPERTEDERAKRVDDEGDVKQAETEKTADRIEIETEPTRAGVSGAIEERQEHKETTKEEKGDGKEPEEEEEEEEDEGMLMNAEFVQKFNDLVTQNEKVERENKLMRQEVVKLHEEIRSLTNKNRSVSEAMEQMTEVLSEHQKKAHDKDKQVIKLRQQEQELETALQAKDMQIAGSRAQYEQVEKTLKLRETTLTTYQERIASLQDKIEKLTQDKESLLDGNQRNSLQIQSKVDELDRMMADEKRQHQEFQQQAKEREAELQAGIAEFTKALAIAQRGVDEKTLELQRSTITLKEAQSESKKLRQELVEYKLRASQVLQSKEKTIQELTERLTSGSEGGANMTANLGELLRTQQELLRAQQERDEYSHTVDQLRGNLQDVQTQAEADAEVFHSQLSNCEELLEKEKKRVQALQIDLLTRSNESASAHSEAERALVEMKETLKARDNEIAKLKKQVSAKSQSSSGQMELENRLRSTTDHLLQKQAQIDTLLSEKSFLQLQLENTLQIAQRDLMAKKRERQPYANKNDHILSIKNSGPTDDDEPDPEPRIRQRPIASLVPSNPYNPNFVSRKVVGAANFLDKMSASAGRVMRIYPLARLGVIAYIALIHLLGFFILASWNPEMHIDGLEDAPPPG